MSERALAAKRRRDLVATGYTYYGAFWTAEKFGITEQRVYQLAARSYRERGEEMLVSSRAYNRKLRKIREAQIVEHEGVH